MQGLNSPIGIKSSEPNQSPFIMNPYRFGGGDVGGWTELARTTLGSAGDNITVSSLADKRYYMILTSALNSGDTSLFLQMGNGSVDTGSNYSDRFSNDGGEYTGVNQTDIFCGDNNTSPKFLVGYIANLSAKEKLYMGHEIMDNGGSAGTAPRRVESTGKWTNTSNPLDTINFYNSMGGSHDTGSEVVVLGWDPTDTHTSNFWEELASVELGAEADELSSGTITAKKYLWVQYYAKKTGTANTRWRFNNDTGSNYCARYSGNGGADGTLTSQTSIYTHANTNANAFGNIFIINNSANEKLAIFHETASVDRSEIVAKWANTSAQITEIDLINTDTGGFESGTLMRVWGSD